jgi:hypothetical protein
MPPRESNEEAVMPAKTPEASTQSEAKDATPVREAPRGEAAWQAERRRVADRNAEVSKAGKKQRREHETRIARVRDAANDPDAPPAPTGLTQPSR